MQWQYITQLSTEEASRLANQELSVLFEIWREQRKKLENTNLLNDYIERLSREIAIETGILERLYSIDRGTTTLLIEHGIDEALISHGATNIAASKVVSLVRDQKESVDSLFDFVKDQRPLSKSYINELHQLLTRNQSSTEAWESTREQMVSVPLLRGKYKTSPNNPLRPDGSVHVYTPPEHVAAEMDNLLLWYNEQRDIAPEVSAAWLHHRFTQIHPFQDGNGRVARCLAILVFIKAGWFPLSIKGQDRDEYIRSLEAADAGNLELLVKLFSQKQRAAFLGSLNLSEKILSDRSKLKSVISSIGENLKSRVRKTTQERIATVQNYANTLYQEADNYLQEASSELKKSIGADFPNAEIFVDHAPNGNEKSHYHRYQIVETAKQLNYFANRQDYQAWVLLVIDVVTPTYILLSFHSLGRDSNGIFACSACAYHKDSIIEDDGRISNLINELQALSESVFQFSYADDEKRMKERFTDWLEQVTVAGLVYWNQSI